MGTQRLAGSWYLPLLSCLEMAPPSLLLSGGGTSLPRSCPEVAYAQAMIAAGPLVLWQFGNTCYCNSVLQALYFCRPFRENVLAYKAQQKKKENLLTCLADLFHSIATQKKKVGVIPPKKFISRLRKENGECCGHLGFEAPVRGTASVLLQSSWVRQRFCVAST